MKSNISFIFTENRRYPLIFNLNVMEEIQEQYGSVSNWGDVVEGDGEPNIKNLKAGLIAMINEGIDICNEENGENTPFVTSKQVGRIITEVGFDNIIATIKQLTVESTKTGDELKNE